MGTVRGRVPSMQSQEGKACGRGYVERDCDEEVPGIARLEWRWQHADVGRAG